MIRSADFRRVARLARRMHAATSFKAVGCCLAAGMYEVISATSMFFACVDMRSKTSSFPIQTMGRDAAKYLGPLGLYHDEVPFVSYYLKNRDAGAVRASDILTISQWNNLAMVNEIWKHIGVQEMLAVEIPSGRPAMHGLVLNRDRRSFTDRDKEVLNLLRLHISESCAAAFQHERLGRKNPFGPEEAIRECITLGADGLPGLWSEESRPLLERYGGGFSARRLPEPVHSWVRVQIHGARNFDLARNPRTPLELKKGGTRLVLRLLSAEDASCHILLMEETLSASRPIFRGLTPRETEVLHWIAQGKTNEEIGLILDMSIHTVKTHVKRILSHLGVETRTAAAAAILTQTA